MDDLAYAFLQELKVDAFVKQHIVKHIFQVGLIQIFRQFFILNVLINNYLAFEFPISVSGVISLMNFLAEPSSAIDFLVHFGVI